MTEFQMYEVARKFAAQGERVEVKGSINTDHILVCVGDDKATFSAHELLSLEDGSQFKTMLGAKLLRDPLPEIGAAG